LQYQGIEPSEDRLADHRRHDRRIQLPENRRLLLESRMRLALAQLNFTIGAFDQNFATKIAAAVARGSTAEGDLIVFTELATTGYPPRDLLNHARFIDLNLALLDRVAALSTDRLSVLIGFVDRNPGSEGKALDNAAGGSGSRTRPRIRGGLHTV
jgi:predicted amidohydrolase